MLPTTVSIAALRNGKESLKLLPTPPPNSNVFLGPSALPHFSNLGLIFLHFKSPVPRVVSSLCSGICIDATFTKWKDKISTGTSWKVISAASNPQPTARHTIFLANTGLDLCWMGDFTLPWKGKMRQFSKHTSAGSPFDGFTLERSSSQHTAALRVRAVPPKHTDASCLPAWPQLPSCTAPRLLLICYFQMLLTQPKGLAVTPRRTEEGQNRVGKIVSIQMWPNTIFFFN